MRSFDSELEKIRDQSLYRELRTLDSPQDVTVTHAGRTLTNFSSNDYLGFANDPAIRHALIVLLSDNHVDEISTSDDLNTLRKRATEILNNTLKKYAKIEGVTDVLFTDFVSQ